MPKINEAQRDYGSILTTHGPFVDIVQAWRFTILHDAVPHFTGGYDP
jgi:hypothetical protein